MDTPEKKTAMKKRRRRQLERAAIFTSGFLSALVLSSILWRYVIFPKWGSDVAFSAAVAASIPGAIIGGALGPQPASNKNCALVQFNITALIHSAGDISGCGPTLHLMDNMWHAMVFPCTMDLLIECNGGLFQINYVDFTELMVKMCFLEGDDLTDTLNICMDSTIRLIQAKEKLLCAVAELISDISPPPSPTVP